MQNNEFKKERVLFLRCIDASAVADAKSTPSDIATIISETSMNALHLTD